MMNKDLSNKIIAISMFIVILVNVANYGIIVIEKGMDYIIPQASAAEINGEVNEEMNEVAEIIVTETISSSSLFDKALSLMDALKSKVEITSLNISFETYYIELNTLFQMSMGRSVFIDSSKTTVKLENGYLSFIYEKSDNISEYAENMIELSCFLEEKEIDLLYIQAPFKISKYDDQLPDGIEDYTNENADEFLEAIEGTVDYIDLREEIYNAGIDQYDFFFKTDHHWTPEGAFWAFGTISEVLNEEYGFDIDERYYDMENYTMEVYEDWCLGSQGRRVGTLLAGVDDISLITPNFETDFIFEAIYDDVYKTGTFVEALLDYENIEIKDYYNLDAYSVYTGANSELKSITNTLNSDGKKVLFVKDSFARVLSPFFVLGCSQVDLIDIRYYNEKSLMDYIEDNDYDMVIFLYNPSLYNDYEKAFVFDAVYE